MRQRKSTKQSWHTGFELTRWAVAVGVVAIFIGIKNAALFQITILACIAIAAVVLAIVAVSVSFWSVGRRSRRLRDPMFWTSIIVNLALIGTVSFYFVRGELMPPYRPTYQAPLVMPDPH